MTQRPAVLIVQPHLGPLTGFLESQYDVWRLWEGPPLEAEHDIRALIVAGEFPLDMALVDRLPNLSLIACFTSGYEAIDVDACRARGLEVTHAPGVNHEDVADHALGLILTARRQILIGDQAVRAGTWRGDDKTITPSMKGARLGIIGLGAIGEASARRADAFGMETRWWGPRDRAAAWPRMASLADLARWAEVLLVACKADESNRGLIDATVLQALGPEGLLVNVARGQLVDETALIAALKAGTLGGAALDVFEVEPTDPARWAGVPNTLLTPHTGGATTNAVPAMLGLLMQNLAAHFAGKPVVTPVR